MVARILAAVGCIGSHRELMRLSRTIEFCETTLLIRSTCYGAMNPFARLRPLFFGEYHPLNPVAADKLWCAYRDLFIVRGVSRDNYDAIKDVLDGDPFMAIHYQFLLDEVERIYTKAKINRIPRVKNPFLQILFLLLKLVSKVSFLLLMALKNFVLVALEAFVSLLSSSKTPISKDIKK